MHLTMRSAYKDAGSAEILYDLLRVRENDPVVNISHQRTPSWHEHLKFYRSHPYRAWYIIRADGAPAGAISATRRNEIGIHLFPDYRRKGIGKWAVAEFMRRHQPLKGVPSARAGHWLANINPKNEPSMRLFQALGGAVVQITMKL